MENFSYFLWFFHIPISETRISPCSGFKKPLPCLAPLYFVAQCGLPITPYTWTTMAYDFVVVLFSKFKLKWVKLKCLHLQFSVLFSCLCLHIRLKPQTMSTPSRPNYTLVQIPILKLFTEIELTICFATMDQCKITIVTGYHPWYRCKWMSLMYHPPLFLWPADSVKYSF